MESQVQCPDTLHNTALPHLPSQPPPARPQAPTHNRACQFAQMLTCISNQCVNNSHRPTRPPLLPVLLHSPNTQPAPYPHNTPPHHHPTAPHPLRSPFILALSTSKMSALLWSWFSRPSRTPILMLVVFSSRRCAPWPGGRSSSTQSAQCGLHLKASPAVLCHAGLSQTQHMLLQVPDPASAGAGFEEAKTRPPSPAGTVQHWLPC